MSEAKERAAQLGDIVDPSLRTVIATGIAAGEEAFRPYDRYGIELPGMTWLPLSLNEDEKLDLFLLRFAPGGQSYPHEHMASEQFLVLDGTLTDCDGHVFQAGDFVRFEPNSKHHSHSDNGCLILVILRERNRPLD